MNDKLQDKLRRLGVVKGARNLKPARPKRQVADSARSPQSRPAANPLLTDAGQDNFGDELPKLSELLPGGELVETAVGACFVVDKVYPTTYRHGADTLDKVLNLSPMPASHFTKDERWRQLTAQDWLFLDTETTGLAGAGTLAFMVGVAFFIGEALVVRQYFLRDHGDETAMLTLLADLLAQKQGLVTFNGRSFDVPLLDGRYLMNRMHSDLTLVPHLDLLHPARRLWRQRLGSCALGALETNLLGLRRSQEDVPGWLIPSLYEAYLRTGDARELLRVFYHNQIDMLSMVTLSARLLGIFAGADSDCHPIDLFSLGKWHAELGLVTDAESYLRRAAAADLPLDLYHRALALLGLLLKRHDRREEAVPLWQQIAATSFDSVEAHVELAKHYEWQRREYDVALRWTEEAIALSLSWEPERAALVQQELAHRAQRLRRKL